ncbi:MAG: DUF262 domain-containing protein [Crocinitomicaceae bacterium]
MSNKLTQKPIYDLLDTNFYIPHYQRGYRWTDVQVRQLLDDIWEYAQENVKADKKDRKFYCLQPVVVKPKIWKDKLGNRVEGFEVIDGQQRLTTIFIILQYFESNFLEPKSLKNHFHKESYRLTYESRSGSEEFLKDIYENFDNVDYYYIYKAFEEIKNWFDNGNDIHDKLDWEDKSLFLRSIIGKKGSLNSVEVIWYEVERKKNQHEDILDSKNLFERLNMGKIALTNSELIKALFLSSDQFKEEGKSGAIRKKVIISQLWDIMERELNVEKFWAFITNKKMEDSSTKIELIFDLISGKSSQKDFYFTFLHFLKLSKSKKSLSDVWSEIELYFNTLVEWFKDRDKYHKIGFLISVDFKVKELLDNSIKMTKSDFENFVHEKIEEQVDFKITDLDYKQGSDKKKILKLLTLFNVVTTSESLNNPTYYPFDLHKRQHWSIEHIHAQNSEDFDPNKKEPWLEWISIHLELLKSRSSEGKSQDLEKTIAKLEKTDLSNLNWESFEKIHAEVLNYFQLDEKDESNRIHHMSNLALLTDSSNSA